MNFKVGDRVRVKEGVKWTNKSLPSDPIGTVFKCGGITIAVGFNDWKDGHCANDDDYAKNRWWFNHEELELAFPLRFTVARTFPNDVSFDTRVEAEAYINEQARSAPSSTFALLQLLATVSTGDAPLKIERFA